MSSSTSASNVKQKRVDKSSYIFTKVLESNLQIPFSKRIPYESTELQKCEGFRFLITFATGLQDLADQFSAKFEVIHTVGACTCVCSQLWLSCSCYVLNYLQVCVCFVLFLYFYKSYSNVVCVR